MPQRTCQFYDVTLTGHSLHVLVHVLRVDKLPVLGRKRPRTINNFGIILLVFENSFNHPLHGNLFMYMI